MEKIIAGVQHFQEHIYPQHSELFERLARKQQRPLALFITCSDSRVNPNLITHTEPGELFLLRNAGNIIPPYGAARGGESATIEYALAVLGIRSIIVCGHSQCGAMQNLLKLDNLAETPAVAAWFSHAEATRRIIKEKYRTADNGDLENATIQENVLVQIDNLRTHPTVAAGLASRDLQIFGWVYHIATGDILTFDIEHGRFVPLSLKPPTPIPAPNRLSVTGACT